ncbi:helicase-related protein [Alphaproteobacteria bacterium]|nr:helicase-related protein [Alphaproteobacteria bacterium]
MFPKNIHKGSFIKALLGPTNTGKTYYAMDRMLSHSSGIIGFPLRLLARENYDKAVTQVGKENVALVTGEEKIIPPRAKYFCCTVESMPLERSFSFLSIDEIQLAADPERGHIFTDRILNARGTEETVFLGAETIRPLLQKMLPNCIVEIRPRLSTLSYIGVKKITRLKPRSAVVAFSVPEVYRIAELVRTKKGGAAIVMGALSPRTRNSQVELYQNGQVDYLIATDAIGMGLNMDIDHVAFASDIKFDGNFPRHLSAPEIAQIAGRAGRHSRNGTFGVVEDNLNFEEDTIDQIETHSFSSLRNIWWRNTELNFNSLNKLTNSLEASPPFNFMRKKVGALDALCLNHFSELDSVKNKIDSKETLSLLWSVCQIPDFSNSLSGMHFNLLEKTFELLLKGKLDNDWIKSQIARHDRVDGEIDTLLNRISNIRTWTFITNRKNWLDEAEYWQNHTKVIEDKLSDELHDRLTQRFVDKRIVILNKTLKEHNNLEAVVRLDGKVFVEEEEVGTLNGFDFLPSLSEGEKAAPILTAARKILPREIERRVRELLMSDNAAFKFNSDGSIRWQNNKVAKLVHGENLYSPKISVNNSELLSDDHLKQIELRINEAVEKNIKDTLSEAINLEKPLLSKLVNSDKNEKNIETATIKDSKNIITNDDTVINNNLSGKALGIAYQVYEGMGSAKTSNLSMSVSNLSESDKRNLARLGLRLGVETIYLPNLLKPLSISLRALLWSVYNNSFPELGPPPDGRVSVVVGSDINHDYYRALGFVPLGNLAIRADIAERLSALIRVEARIGKFKINDAMLSISGSTKIQMEGMLYDLGYIKVGEEPSTLVDQIPINIFERQKKIKNNNNIVNPSAKKKQNLKMSTKNSSKNKKLDKPLDPLSPFAILKTIKIK